MSDKNNQVWHPYRIRHRLAAGLLILGLPGAFAIAIALKIFDISTSQIGLVTIVLIWACLFGYAAFRVVRFPCPRCGHHFGGARACTTCALLLYESPSDSPCTHE